MGNTSFIALGIAVGLVLFVIFNIGMVSLTLGALESLFGKPKLKFLKSAGNDENFAFALKWNAAKEPARIDTVKVRLFNPFGFPTQVDVSNKFDKEKSSFARDVNFGENFTKILNADGMEKGQVQVELYSSTDGVFFQFDYSGSKFKKLLGNAKQTVSDLAGITKETRGPKIITPVKSFIADTVPGQGSQLAIATNPAFEAYFSNMGGASTTGETEAVQENFSVAKVWIEDGCIVCNACEDIYPDVFDVTEDSCLIKPGAPLDDGLRIEEAAEACPVEIIKYTPA